MSNDELYRVAADGVGVSRAYERLSSARNLASNRYGTYLSGSWEGVNSKVIDRQFWDWKASTTDTKLVKYTIQKLTPVLRQHPAGAFVLGLEWVDLDG
jgi:hypothetical protein